MTAEIFRRETGLCRGEDEEEFLIGEDIADYGVTGEIIASVAEDALAGLETAQRVARPDVPIPHARSHGTEVNPDADAVRPVAE